MRRLADRRSVISRSVWSCGGRPSARVANDVQQEHEVERRYQQHQVKADNEAPGAPRKADTERVENLGDEQDERDEV